MEITPALLVILDGFGHGEASPDNAITQAHTPNLDRLLQNCPHTLINASESFVGLPAGQMGNSEVGHLNIGAGRVVVQEFDRINNSILNHEFELNPALVEAVGKAKSSALHIFGLVSDGGIHSHQEHIFAMLRMAAKAGVRKIYVHAFLDGRDTPPRSAKQYLAALENVIVEAAVGRIASVTGRYYAMDRDKRWERVAPAYQVVVDGVGEFTAESAQAA